MVALYVLDSLQRTGSEESFGAEFELQYIHVTFYAVDFIAALLNKNSKSLSQNGAKTFIKPSVIRFH